MLKYIVKRLLWIIPVLIGVTIIVFTILYFSPGDPAYLALGDNATPEAVEAYRVEMGINGTYWERLGRTLGGLLKGDLGLSYRSRTPVLNELLVRFKVTFNISAWSIVLGIILGIFFGIISALKQNTLWDSLSTGCALFGISMPMFWQGLMLTCKVGHSFPIGFAIAPRGKIDGLLRYADVKTGNETFDKRFTVKTDNGDAALLTLTPRMQEKILAAASVSPGPLFVTFCQDGRVSAAVRTTGRNFFVPEKAGAEGARARLTENLRKILAIVDEANPVAAAPAQEGEAEYAALACLCAAGAAGSRDKI